MLPQQPQYNYSRHVQSTTGTITTVAAPQLEHQQYPQARPSLQRYSCAHSQLLYTVRDSCAINACMYVSLQLSFLWYLWHVVSNWQCTGPYAKCSCGSQHLSSVTFQGLCNSLFSYYLFFFASWLTDLFVYIGIFRFNWPCLMCCHSVFTLRRALVRPERTPNTNNRSRARRSEPTERGNRWNDVFLRPLN